MVCVLDDVVCFLEEVVCFLEEVVPGCLPAGLLRGEVPVALLSFLSYPRPGGLSSGIRFLKEGVWYPVEDVASGLPVDVFGEVGECHPGLPVEVLGEVGECHLVGLLRFQVEMDVCGCDGLLVVVVCGMWSPGCHHLSCGLGLYNLHRSSQEWKS